MAAADLGAIADRLLRGFLAPLVLGGEMTPSKPIGGKAALALGEERVAGDPELVSHVELARVRRARELVPVDRMPKMTPDEWALGAVLHDLVQATHPGFDAAFRRKGAARLVAVAEQTLSVVPRPATLGDVLARHTWFARLFEITRTDTVVSWWVGKRTFLGTEPPKRLTTWPELRRVNVATTARSLIELPANGATIDATLLDGALTRFLAHTPLTDVATMTRPEPAFVWRAESLALVASPRGRTLALRALAHAPAAAVDTALGRATRALFAQRAWEAARHAIALLADRALTEALTTTGGGRPSATDAKATDALFARAVGALAAREQLARGEVAILHEEEQKRVLAALEGAASPSAVKEVEAAMRGAGAAAAADG